MNEWLLQVMRELKQVLHSPALQNGRRMTSVLSIMLCFDHLIPKYIRMSTFKNEDIADMLSMLAIYPDMEQKKCRDYDYVCQVLEPHVKKTVTDTITSFCNQLHHSTYLSQPHWLYAIPLLHFLRGASRPFENLELESKKMKWGDAYLGLQNLRQHVYNGSVK